MRILCFTYDFPHQKSVDGLLALYLAGYKDVTCLAAPRKELNIKASPTRITPIVEAYHPKDIAARFKYKYVVGEHSMLTVKQQEMVQGHQVGVVLGARILPEELVNRLPIINMHPGLLPWNRNLDNIKNAILYDLPQGVTTHIIDKHVDRGHLIERQLVNVFEDDTILDIYLRGQRVSMDMMISAIKSYDVITGNPLGKGTYFNVLSPEKDALVNSLFASYKMRYKEILKNFQIIYEKSKL